MSIGQKFSARGLTRLKSRCWLGLQSISGAQGLFPRPLIIGRIQSLLTLSILKPTIAHQIRVLQLSLNSFAQSWEKALSRAHVIVSDLTR